MKTLAPEFALTSFRKEMNHLFDRFWDGDEFTPDGGWVPKVDVSETRETLVVKVDVPGIEPKDIQVLLENGILTIKGERKLESTEKDERFYRTERTYGSFARILRLPANVDGTKVNAAFHHGVLTVTLPKTAEARGMAIPIKVA